MTNNAAPTPVLIAAYQAAFDHFNRELFDGALDGVVLNFSRHAKALGFFAPERWGTRGAIEGRIDDGRRTSEISLNPTYLATRPLVETYSTLVHEMVHALEHQEGRPARRGYHAKTWADNMEARGLMPSNTGAPGGARTGDRMTHWIIPGGRYEQAFATLPEAAKLPMTCVDTAESKAKKKARNKIKYTCPECQCNVWGKPGLKVACQECGSDDEPVTFEPEDNEQESGT